MSRARCRSLRAADALAVLCLALIACGRVGYQSGGDPALDALATDGVADDLLAPPDAPASMDATDGSSVADAALDARDAFDAPVDAPRETSIPPDAASIALGGACVPDAAATCVARADCFSFAGGATICGSCGHYGERPCEDGGTPRCAEGVFNDTDWICQRATPATAFGQAGGACVRNSDCGTPGQCYRSICLVCGGIGQACCCTGSCACTAGTCVTGSAHNWTVCRAP